MSFAIVPSDVSRRLADLSIRFVHETQFVLRSVQLKRYNGWYGSIRVEIWSELCFVLVNQREHMYAPHLRCCDSDRDSHQPTASSLIEV